MDEPPLKPSGKNYGLSLFMSYAVHIPRGIDGFYSRLLFFIYIFVSNVPGMSGPLGIQLLRERLSEKKSALDNPER